VYNHFTGMAELRDAVTHELTHDFLNAVTRAIAELTDPRERASAALRHYLHRVRAEPGWGWSIINLSANGIPFGAGTWREARATVQQGLDAGLLHVGDADTGRDLLLGASLAAVGALVRGNVPQDYPERIAAAILMGLGVAQYEAEAMARRPLPVLDMATSPN
jgi:AcrR family transcriptional regulator